jgi:hypothetical protein
MVRCRVNWSGESGRYRSNIEYTPFGIWFVLNSIRLLRVRHHPISTMHVLTLQLLSGDNVLSDWFTGFMISLFLWAEGPVILKGRTMSNGSLLRDARSRRPREALWGRTHATLHLVLTPCCTYCIDGCSGSTENLGLAYRVRLAYAGVLMIAVGKLRLESILDLLLTHPLRGVFCPAVVGLARGMIF